MKELKKDWKAGNFKSCYLFYGTENYLIRNFEKALVEAILPQGAEMMNHDILEEKRATAAGIMDAAETFPFLSEKRLITVRNSGFFQKGSGKEEGEKLLSFFENLPECACIVFIEEKVEKNLRLYKAVAKYGRVVEFKQPTEKELITWLKRECSQGGVSISDSVVQFFLQTVEHDMESMEREIQKVIAYKGGNGTVTPAEIGQVCSPSLEAKVFDLVRAVAEQRPESAISIYRNMLLMKESPYLVLSLITRQFRMILGCLLLDADSATAAEISTKLEIREFAVRDYLKQSKRFSVNKWKTALEDCLETDLDIKTGKIGEEIAVELLIMKYSSGMV